MHRVAIDGDHAMPHHQCTRINTKDYFVRLLQRDCIFTRYMKIDKSIKIFINYFLGPILFLWLSYSIYRQVQRQPDLGTSWQQIRASFGTPMVINLFAVFLLMIVNWGIEAFKWKISVQQVQHVKYFTAFKAILSGTSFSVTTPNRVGEYLGRVL